MAHSVRQHLQLEIEDYDAAIRQFVPGYEVMLEQVAAAVQDVSPQLVLDLGAGTGALTAIILERCAGSVVELIDVDVEMLARAEMRLQRFGERIRLRQQSFADVLPACDAVVASLALHHVPTLQAKRQIFAHVYQALKVGGVFVNADVTMPETETERTADYVTWTAHLVSCGITESRAYQHFAEWSDEDTYFSCAQELAAMAQVGFEAECVWRQTPSTVLVGRKKAQQ